MGLSVQAVIFIGVQASGKSTFFREHFFDTHVRINLDMLKTRHREQILLEACLRGKQSFVVDNTNPTIEDRKRYILPAKQAHFEVIGYYFKAPITASIQLNLRRSGKQHIPAAGIWNTYRKLQPPTLEEGFDQLYSVELDPAGAFVVKGWCNGR